MMLSISYYINPNTRALTSNYKNTVIKDKEAYLQQEKEFYTVLASKIGE